MQIATEKNRKWGVDIKAGPLLYTWLASTTVVLGILVYLYFAGLIEARDLRPAFEVINKIYAPLVLPIFFYYFGLKEKRSNAQKRKANKYVSGMVVFCSIIWNLFVVGFLIQVVAGREYLEVAVATIENVGNGASWILGGSLGYFFAVNA